MSWSSAWDNAIMMEFAEDILNAVKELKKDFEGEDLWDHADEVGRAVLEIIYDTFGDDLDEEEDEEEEDDYS